MNFIQDECMLRNLLQRIGTFGIHEEKLSQEEKFFCNIVGYADIKKLLYKSVISKDPINILLTGPPSCSKSTFLLNMLDSLNNAFFVDGAGASGAGMIDHLFNNNTKYLLIDEIDKMKKNDQATLLNVMETGILSETKSKGKTRQTKMKLWIYATSNDSKRLSNPMRSRFIELFLDEYSYEQFAEITKRLLEKRYALDSEISEQIAYSVWNKMGSKDVRNAINIGKLSKTIHDVNWLVDLQIRYASKKIW